jgi:hypothetical protein
VCVLVNVVVDLLELEVVMDRERKAGGKQEEAVLQEGLNAMQDNLSSTLQVEVESQMLRVLSG